MHAFETWEIDSKNVFLYTEEYGFAKLLFNEFDKSTVYFKNNVPFVWQFALSKRVLQLILKKLDNQRMRLGDESRTLDCKNLPVDLYELTEVRKIDFVNTDINPKSSIPKDRSEVLQE